MSGPKKKGASGHRASGQRAAAGSAPENRPSGPKPEVATTTAEPAERIELLENGEEFFPRVCAAIAGARKEVLLETFILREDSVGRALQAALIKAARGGAKVTVTVDDFGSDSLTEAYVAPLRVAGVQFHRYAPAPTWCGVRTNLFRRLHRKLVCIDQRLAYVGGMNFCEDHLRSHAPISMQDYAAELEGPVVRDIRRLMRTTMARLGEAPLKQLTQQVIQQPIERLRHRLMPLTQLAGTQLVVRDNALNRHEIERHYRAAIRTAQSEILIANAYFFPSYRLLHELAKAARRGVKVELILQGRPDIWLAQFAARNLYDYLMRAGVVIHEFIERPFHGKVAVIDRQWTTLGSSNLDPLSLALNLEANIISRDLGFAGELRQRLEVLIRKHCLRVEPRQYKPRFGGQLLGGLVFHLLRRFPKWAGMLPGHTPPSTPRDALPRAPVAGDQPVQ